MQCNADVVGRGLLAPRSPADRISPHRRQEGALIEILQVADMRAQRAPAAGTLRRARTFKKMDDLP